LKRALTVILITTLLGMIGLLVYIVASRKRMKNSPNSTCWELGTGRGYPDEFVLNGNGQASVKYSEVPGYADKSGRITLGISNHEQQEVTYSVIFKINGTEINIIYDGKIIDRLDNIKLKQNEKWERELGFAPLNIAEDQKVQIFLYKDTDVQPSNTLYFWMKYSH